MELIGLHQIRLINQIIQNDRYLSKFRSDVMKYPSDKNMYNTFELNSMNGRTVKILTQPYNEVWRVTW